MNQKNQERDGFFQRKREEFINQKAAESFILRVKKPLKKQADMLWRLSTDLFHLAKRNERTSKHQRIYSLRDGADV